MDLILIASPDEVVRETIDSLLKDPYNLVHAKSVREMFESLRDKPIDLVVMDRALDTGRPLSELLGEIAKIGKNVPVIVLVPDPKAADVTEFRSSGGYEIITEPIDEWNLPERVKKLVEYARSLSELALLKEQVERLKITSKVTSPKMYETLFAQAGFQAATRSQTFESLRKFLEAIVNIRDREKLFELIIDAVTDAFAVNKAALVVVEKDESTLSVKSSRGLGADFFNQLKPFDANEGIYSWLRRNDRILLVEDLSMGDLREVEKEVKLLQAKLCVSLSFKDKRKPLGYLSLGNKYTGEPYSRGELESIFILARYAATSIENALLLEETKELAIKDELTELFNRHHWPQRLNIELERSKRYGRFLSLAIFDIDHFKEFNDSLGYQAGDRILRDVARLLLTSSRSTDVVGRYGGEEFIAILPETTSEVAHAYCERVRQSVEQFGKRETGKLAATGLTISGGLTSFDPDKDSVETLIERANDALRTAKREGRNQIRIS